MRIRKTIYSKLSILILSILTVFSCSSEVYSKKSKGLKDVSSVVKAPVDTSQSIIIFDTILIAVKDEMITLSPKRDIEGQPYVPFPISAPIL